MSPSTQLRDNPARVRAMTAHDRTLLVEAGAGVGKTAILAGRIALLLANGTPPREIAAVTFTELAASELLARIQQFAEALAGGQVPVELAAALPGGANATQRAHLASALSDLSEMACCTIHGFCQRLLMPYPVEGNLDPGATILDADDADRLFNDVFDTWLREILADAEQSLIAELIYLRPEEGIKLVREIAAELLSEPDLRAPLPPQDLGTAGRAFTAQARQFLDFIHTAEAEEPESQRVAECFAEMAKTVQLACEKSRETMLAELVTGKPHGELCKVDGDFRKFRQKTKWIAAAKAHNLSSAQGTLLFEQAEQYHERCCQGWRELIEIAASTTLSEVISTVRAAVSAYHARKRSAALLDFDDLIFAARRLLRADLEVRAALRQRYRCILVDEFQDTDPRQNEIFWLLASADDADLDRPWPEWPLKDGALFLVGDPKQSIYRFRGADTAAYLAARSSIERRSPDDVITITTNFRSCAPIIGYVNERFEAPMSEEGQPGFHALDAFHGAAEDQVCVAAYDVRCAQEGARSNTDARRDCEAEAIAELCSALIDRHPVRAKDGSLRPCRPGDIALLAPTGKDLWRYEEAFDAAGVPVSSQAGKGLFRRQEVQDLIALTRVLADPGDTLALLAFLRGPLIGLTQEELLNVAWETQTPDRRPGLALDVDTAKITHPLARSMIEQLRRLRRRAATTTPHAILSKAVEQFGVRASLRLRHGRNAARALTNVDVFLELARNYSLYGLRAFSEAMRTAWEGSSSAIEGRTDAPGDAVALYTIHASKGLEWPIVVPINMMTRLYQPSGAIVDRTGPTLHAKVLGAAPASFASAMKSEGAEQRRERQRLWYVAATRARELLVLPRLDVEPDPLSWAKLVDLGLENLGTLTLPQQARLPIESEPQQVSQAAQAPEVFVAEHAVIEDSTRIIRWTAPSAAPSVVEETEKLEPQPDKSPDEERIAGSANRGILLHKLLEEVLTGELGDTRQELTARAKVLAPQLAVAETLESEEVAHTAWRALRLPEIQELRPRMIAEVPVLASEFASSKVEVITSGVADAIVLGENGAPEIVIDWKSDVAPSPSALVHYEAQVRQYLQVTGARRGLIVLATPGKIIDVAPQTAAGPMGETAEMRPL